MRGIFVFGTKPLILYLLVVLQFNQSDTEAVLTLTLTENVSLTEPYYLFVFTHTLTKQQVKFIKSSDEDESDFIERYNQFTINPAVTFLNAPIGQWNYKVYEQASNSNTDETLTGDVLEYGKLIIYRTTAFAFTKYNEPQTFKAYNG